jgi:hypothetical protein
MQQGQTKLGSRRGVVAALATGLLLAGSIGPAAATEGGGSFYLPGQRGQNAAGLIPVEGVFFALPNYFYSGDTSGSRQLPIGGALALGVDADLFLTLPTVIWATPVEVAGGRLALTGTVVYGSADLTARAAINIPGIVDRVVERSDDRWALGDPVVGASLGWTIGELQWSLTGSVNIPAGDYDAGRLANISLNRWATDLTSAATWLDKETGIELSGALGVTFNGENDDTDYDSGNELHAEAAAFYHFNPQLSAGINAYYLKQVSGDSGTGAQLGSFKGEVLGIGPGLTANFQVGPAPVTVNLRWFFESNVENRLEGDAGWLTFSLPLWVPESAR